MKARMASKAMLTAKQRTLPKSLQEKIGVTADGMFGPNTLKAAMSF